MAKQPELPPPGDPGRGGAILRLIDQARKGDAAAAADLRPLLAIPAVVDAIGGDLPALVERSVVKAMAPDDLAFREAVKKKLDDFRAELLGPSPTPVERVLVDRASLCWLQVHDAEARAAQASPSLSPRWATFYQDRVDRANKRFLAAIKTLAQVRRLAVPALQVNIAKKQFNIVATGSPPDVPGK